MNDCELYRVNPFTGWAAQHVTSPSEELETRFVGLTTKDGKFTGRLAKMRVCGSCAKLLDAEYDAAKPLPGEKGDDAV